MSKFRQLYRSDLHRLEWDNKYAKLFSYFHRKSQCTNNPFLQKLYRAIFKIVKTKHGLEISYNTEIGEGFRLIHPFGITINTFAKIGRNVDIYKGVTIGQEFRGFRKGAPVIGNEVWIGVNATVVGKITIGNDVLIAPNTFVNCDIPSHSIVFGNPCIIKHKENSTEGYIVNRV